MSKTLLIVGSDTSQLLVVARIIQYALSYHIQTASTEEGLECVRHGKPQPDALLVNAQPEETVLHMIQTVHQLKPHLPIVALVKYGEREQAMQFMQNGASDFLMQPLDADRLRCTLDQVFRIQRMHHYIVWLEHRLAGNTQLPVPPQGLLAGSAMLDETGKMKTLRLLQQEAIRFALLHSDGCMTRAARNLGIGRSTLYRKISQFNLERYISRENQTARPTMKVPELETS